MSQRLYLFVLQTLSLVVKVVPGVEDSQDESASPTLHLAVVGEQVLLQNVALHFGVAAVGVTRHTELHVVSDQVASRRRQVCSLTRFSFMFTFHIYFIWRSKLLLYTKHETPNGVSCMSHVFPRGKESFITQHSGAKLHAVLPDSKNFEAGIVKKLQVLSLRLKL